MRKLKILVLARVLTKQADVSSGPEAFKSGMSLKECVWAGNRNGVRSRAELNG